MHQFMKTDEVAAVLRLTPWQVVNLCRAGKLRATKPSGQWLIDRADLDAYIEAGSNQSGDAA